MKKNILLSSILLATLAFSCEEKPELIEEETQSETSMEGKVSQEVAEKEQYCFRNETPYDNGEGNHLVDIESLKITIEGNSVSGSFEWTPAEKGGLSGNFKGTKNGNEIEAVYDEINSDEPVSVKITLSDDEAVFAGPDESLGSFTIKKSDCN